MLLTYIHHIDSSTTVHTSNEHISILKSLQFYHDWGCSRSIQGHGKAHYTLHAAIMCMSSFVLKLKQRGLTCTCMQRIAHSTVTEYENSSTCEMYQGGIVVCAFFQ